MEPNHPVNTAAALPARAVVALMTPIDGGSSAFYGRTPSYSSRGAKSWAANRQTTLLRRTVLLERKATTRKGSRRLRLLVPQEEAGGGGVGGSPGGVHNEKEIHRARARTRGDEEGAKEVECGRKGKRKVEVADRAREPEEHLLPELPAAERLSRSGVKGSGV